MLYQQRLPLLSINPPPPPSNNFLIPSLSFPLLVLGLAFKLFHLLSIYSLSIFHHVFMLLKYSFHCILLCRVFNNINNFLFSCVHRHQESHMDFVFTLFPSYHLLFSLYTIFFRVLCTFSSFFVIHVIGLFFHPLSPYFFETLTSSPPLLSFLFSFQFNHIFLYNLFDDLIYFILYFLYNIFYSSVPLVFIFFFLISFIIILVFLFTFTLLFLFFYC
ncbi:unnamed protein product [Acanthosepion pharaonis]|uniref:Uncharacterized protein n=1 Tax=Acanthosepion pharaonis TaxID=158019 RepID=A0A812DE26_ACAPH|nr:unnamed protein product [Sepia pharaonis]